MLTIGWKQILLILIVGFLLFGNLPKRYKELKGFFSSSDFQEDVQKVTEIAKKTSEKLSKTSNSKKDLFLTFLP